MFKGIDDSGYFQEVSGKKKTTSNQKKGGDQQDECRKNDDHCNFGFHFQFDHDVSNWEFVMWANLVFRSVTDRR